MGGNFYDSFVAHQPPAEVSSHAKVLSMIQRWGISFNGNSRGLESG